MSVGGQCCAEGLSPRHTSWDRDKSETAADSRAAGGAPHHTYSPTYPQQVLGSYHTVTVTTLEEPVCGLEVNLNLQGS